MAKINDPKSLKDSAEKYFAKGKWSKALEEYLKLWKAIPNDFRTRLKIAEILQKLGKVAEAKAVYRKTALAYAQDGFLIQAISLYKMVLRLDPKDPTSLQMIEQLNQQRGIHKDQAAQAMASLGTVPESAITDTAQYTSDQDSANLLIELFQEDIPAPQEGDVSHTPLFSDLNLVEFRAVVDRLIPWKVPMGTVLCEEGSSAESMFVISSGAFQVSIVDPTTRQERMIATLGDGDFFGEISLFTQGPRTATCKALEESELLEIRKEDLDDMMEEHPRIRVVLDSFYQERVLDTFLAKSEIFSHFPQEVRQELSRRFQRRDLSEGEVLFEEGQNQNQLFFVRNGMMGVQTQSSGKFIHLADLGMGEFLGEVSLISGKPTTAKAYAKTKVELLVLNQSDFQWATDMVPQVLQVIQQCIDRRVQSTLQKIQAGL